MQTKHALYDNASRENFIKSIGGYGYILSEKGKLFIARVDKGHKNGDEYHVLTSNAMIVIYNVKTGKHITTLIARPEQLKRYGFNVPASVLQLAINHQLSGYNYK